MTCDEASDCFELLEEELSLPLSQGSLVVMLEGRLGRAAFDTEVAVTNYGEPDTVSIADTLDSLGPDPAMTDIYKKLLAKSPVKKKKSYKSQQKVVENLSQ